MSTTTRVLTGPGLGLLVGVLCGLALFRALAQAMLVIVGWALKLAPIGVFALVLTDAHQEPAR